MLFSSIPFLYYFLPLVLVCYFCVPFRWKNFILLFFSLIFYSWGEPRYIFLMVLSILLGYIEGILIERKKHSRLILAGACCIHLGLLMYFKYIDFLIGNLNAIGLSIPLFHIALPIGISFYTFQILSYLIDVYRKDCTAQTNLISFGAYVSMFPQLIAGPIVRYKDIAAQLEVRKHSVEKAALGIRKFILGLSKKVLLANSLGALCSTFQTSTDRSVLYYWLYAFSFALQIYFDFSGYSDMAIGLGKMFGFHFEENFNYPYISKSVSEFWRRWHISLSTWFREYVYFPLGGSRVENKDKMVRNLLVVWLLTGLWHGANWTFVFWGLFNFVCLLLERLFLFEKWKAHPVWKHLYTMLMVNFGWVLFRSESFYQFQEYLGNMFGLNGNGFFSGQALMFLQEYAVYWVIGILLCLPAAGWLKKKLASLPKLSKTSFAVVYPVGMAGLFFVCVTYLVRSGYNPFIYFNF